LAKKLLFRRSPYLICYWANEQLVFHNYATGVRVAAAPLTCTVLDHFDRWQPADVLFNRMDQFSRPSLRKAVSELAKYSLLQRSDRRQSATESALAAWQYWNPAAGFFHLSTKDMRYTFDPVEEESYLRRWAQKFPMPSSTKHYPRARKFPLLAPNTAGEFPNVLLARRTWRQFSQEPVELCTLSTLLGLTFGIQQWVDFLGLGRLPLKTSPSGGARHPIEAYVLALRVVGLHRGLYHYAADSHCLELLKPGASSQQVIRLLAGQSWYGSVAALVLMTAVFPRDQWKYQYPRAYRAVLLDAGHVCQTFCLVATWLGLAPFCSMALADSEAEKIVGVDGVTESVIYAAGVGKQPSGAQ